MKDVRNERWPSQNHKFLNVTDAPNRETFVRLSARTSIRLDVARVVENQKVILAWNYQRCRKCMEVKQSVCFLSYVLMPNNMHAFS